MNQCTENRTLKNTRGPRPLWILALPVLAVVFNVAPLHAGEDAAPDAEKLIAKLDEADFDTRRAIEKQIEDLGESARAALEKAAQKSSFETRQVAARLLGKLSNSTLTIELRDRQGNPLKDTLLEVNVYSAVDGEAINFEAAPRELKTNAQGLVTLKALAPGPYSLKFVVPGHHAITGAWSSTDANFQLMLARGANRFVHTVQPNLEFKARILNQAGEPLRDASVTLIPDYTGAASQQPSEDEPDRNGLDAEGGADLAELNIEEAVELKSVSDAEGHATIANVTEGVFKVVVRHADYRTRHAGYVSLKSGQPPGEPLLVKLNKSVPRKNTLSVSFLDAKGEVLSGKEMFVLIRPIQTDAALETEVAYAKRQLSENQFEFISRNDWRVIQTSDSGVYEVKDVAPGDYSVLAQDQENEQTYFEASVSSVAPPDPGKDAATVVVLRPRPLSSIRGRVTNQKGEGVAELNVVALPSNDVMARLFVENPELIETYIYYLSENIEGHMTDQNGRFEAKNLAPGRYVVIVYQESYVSALVRDVEVTAKDNKVLPDIVVDALEGGSWRVSGKVRGIDGKPVPSATVYVMDRTGNVSTGNSADDGSFELVMNGSQPEVLGASAPGFQGLSQPAPRGSNTTLDVTLQKAVPGSLRVSVSGAGERALRLHMQRVFELAQGSAETPLQVSARGLAQQRNIPPGKYRLTAQDDTNSTEVTQDIEIRGGEETRCEMKLPEPGRLEGKIVLEGGALPPGSQLQISRNAQGSAGAYSASHYQRFIQPAADGSFVSPPLAEGSYTLLASGPGLSASRGVKIHLKAGAVVKQDIAVQRACRLRAECGPSYKFVEVSLYSPGGWVPARQKQNADDDTDEVLFTARTDARGSVEFQSLAPGEYDLVVASPDGESSRVVRGVRVDVSHQNAPLEIKVPALVNPATLNGSLKLDTASLRQLRSGQSLGAISVELVLDSGEAFATSTLELPGKLSRSAIQVLKVDGKGELQKLENSVSFEFNALQPGKYRVRAVLKWMGRSDSEWTQESETIELNKMLPEVVVRAGEKCAIGELQMDIPKSIMERIMTAQRKHMEWMMLENILHQDPNENDPGFQP